eukprot:356721-Chlamydomonas_euryale.AAC.7
MAVRVGVSAQSISDKISPKLHSAGLPRVPAAGTTPAECKGQYLILHLALHLTKLSHGEHLTLKRDMLQSRRLRQCADQRVHADATDTKVQRLKARKLQKCCAECVSLATWHPAMQ